MSLEWRSFSYRPHGLSGRSKPRQGGESAVIPFFFPVPALASGLVIFLKLRVTCWCLSTLRSKGAPQWV